MLSAVAVAGCGGPGPPPAPSAPPLRLVEPVDAQPGLHLAELEFHLADFAKASRRPPDFLRGGIALADNETGVRRLVEIPMFLPGDTSGRDSRASLLAPTRSVNRFHVDVPPDAELRTAAGYAILPNDVGRLLRFQARVTPLVLRNGQPSEIATIDVETLADHLVIDETVRVASDGSWLPLTADLSLWAGRRVVLELTVAEEPAGDTSPPATPVWAGWAAPEIVERKTQQDGFDLLWISLDTLRADRLGTYGYARRSTSPHLDRLAEGGVVFETAISQAPWTRPSHRSMFTGNYPSSNHGFSSRLLAVETWRAGWRTAALTGGGQVDARMGFHPGFETYRVQYWHEDLDTVTRWYQANRGRRTFLFLHTFAVHDPYTDHRFARAESLSPGDVGELFGRDEWNERQRRLTDDEEAYVDALYDGGIAAVDEVLGRLFQSLEASGRIDRTLVVITSDHGEQLFEHGSWRHGAEVYDHQIHVPAILHLPPALRRKLGPVPSRISDQVQLVDLYPTVLELLGIPVDHEVQGRSLVPLLRGEPMESRLAFSENVNVDAYERKSFRTLRWKLVWQTPKGAARERAAEGPGVAAQESVRLFDLARDPGELHDVSHDHSDAVVKHLALMQRLVEGGKAPDSVLPADQVPDDLPPDLRERLRALGYID